MLVSFISIFSHADVFGPFHVDHNSPNITSELHGYTEYIHTQYLYNIQG